jgi:Nucleotide modification associated domain 2
MKIYFYKLTADSGGAPCVERGLLSLAICKPMIRKMAREGDLIFGFAAKSLHPDNRLIYVARVTKAVRDGQYYQKRQYFRRPDCIYRQSGRRFMWKRSSAYHGPKDLSHDLGLFPDYPRANVLLSRNFRYFGKSGTSEYKSKFRRVGRAVENLGRGARVHHNDELRRELQNLAKWLWQETNRKVLGQPTNAPSRHRCLRGRFCGVV